MSSNNSLEWLQEQLSETGIGTLSNLAKETGINKGTLSKYFRGVQRPSIDVIEPLCKALRVSPESLLIAMNAYKAKR
jgi:transcriptional regulator with XRE-family HTH domain